MEKYVTNINKNIYISKEKILNGKREKNNNAIHVNPNKEIGVFLGFGSAITESSAYNYGKLSDENKKKFLKDYYTKDGLNYQFGRISIGSNDFSLRSFQYAKKKDLSDFSIMEDEQYTIPFLLNILNTKKISLIASPWSPPKMYKKIPFLYWGIKLAKKHYNSYSNYLVKFINEYKKRGITIDYLTMQNEPMARQRWESCKFKLLEQKDFIYNYLLPKLDKTKLLLWDHNKDNLYEVISFLYQHNKRIAGACFHYYTGHEFNEIEKLREMYPKMMLVNSEMCCSYSEYDEVKWIGSAEYYLNDIIGDMNSGVNAYLDWNILLDKNGGPTHSKNYVKSASVLDGDDYIKSPIYYYLYHVSHFISKHSIVVESESSIKELKVVSFKNDNQIIIVVMNNSNKDINYNLALSNKRINDLIDKHSITTYSVNI